jgi:hypothetical protein
MMGAPGEVTTTRGRNRTSDQEWRPSMTLDDAAGSSETDTGEVAEVTRTVEDYFLGWFDGDPDRMRRALHPELAKRSHVSREGKPPVVRGVTAAQMIGWTTEGQGRETDPDKRRLEIVVDEIHGSIASARVDSVPYREYVHLARTPDGWRVVNTLWTWTDPDHPGD